jgi:hypothetical protein
MRGVLRAQDMSGWRSDYDPPSLGGFMLRHVYIVLALILGFASPALAQRAPDMATLDRGDGITKIGLDLGLSSLEAPPYDLALRFELYGQYVTRSGLGIYGALPISRSFGGYEGDTDLPPPEARDRTSLNNIDLGLLYVVESGVLSWVFRGGVLVPTSTGGYDAAATRYYAAAPRLTDLAMASSDTHVRLSLSPLIHANKMFLRADIGFDIDVGDDDYHYLRLNLGAGYDFGLLALSLELVNTATFGDLVRDEDFFHALALTVRFMGEQLQPFISIGSPIDDYRRDRVNFFAAGGIQVAF